LKGCYIFLSRQNEPISVFIRSECKLRKKPVQFEKAKKKKRKEKILSFYEKQIFKTSYKSQQMYLSQITPLSMVKLINAFQRNSV